MNDPVLPQPSEAGAELTRYRRGIMRQHFYGVITGMCKSLIDARAENYEREFGANQQFLDLCRTDALIQIAEELKRMNDLTAKFAPFQFLEQTAPNLRNFEYFCRRCAQDGMTEMPLAGFKALTDKFITAAILVEHSKQTPSCPATNDDIVLRPWKCSDQEWAQSKSDARQANLPEKGDHFV